MGERWMSSVQPSQRWRFNYTMIFFCVEMVTSINNDWFYNALGIHFASWISNLINLNWNFSIRTIMITLWQKPKNVDQRGQPTLISVAHKCRYGLVMDGIVLVQWNEFNAMVGWTICNHPQPQPPLHPPHPSSLLYVPWSYFMFWHFWLQ